MYVSTLQHAAIIQETARLKAETARLKAAAQEREEAYDARFRELLLRQEKLLDRMEEDMKRSRAASLNYAVVVLRANGYPDITPEEAEKLLFSSSLCRHS